MGQRCPRAVCRSMEMEHIHMVLIVVIGGLLLVVIGVLLFFYAFVFRQICCPPRRKSDRLRYPRDSIPLTNITHCSSQPTETERV
ncbi:PREDICTED: uncharacterized protein LOC108556519 [Nicrophorus vespilloides]|uniref:Uncharacterized protein LOC108556519 n=1 Tax=Nicrophorus vespilloides TaxID=110193 RepID=A0ABM1M0Q7_NICVS|nr:PREDICTED: uncharacterized protein LOC108556519 [Nicrophorus vespilloides]